MPGALASKVSFGLAEIRRSFLRYARFRRIMAIDQRGGMRPQINISKIPVGGGVAGLMIALIVIVIALIGIPATRLFLFGSAVLGVIVALILRWTAHPRG